MAGPPNFVVIFADDLGYGDLGCYGSKKNRTPNLDRMAAEGMRLTSFYSTSGVCSPSRASLMTGCYPRRVNLHVDSEGRWVLFPRGNKGLHSEEWTVAEVLQQQGYATACIGKWHLGDQRPFLPTRQGFDDYFGIPYSNDMGVRKQASYPPLPLMRNQTVIEAPADQATLTQRYTAEAVRFIEQHQQEPFFLYLPHTMPHLPLHASDRFRGKSQNGRYGDAIEEIDWSTGEILNTLERLGLDQHTLVIFTSDNGSTGAHGGSNAPLRGRKGSTDEGGMRVPCLARWPGRIPSGATSDEVAATLDLLPTLASLAGDAISGERVIDGHDIWPILAGQPDAQSPHETFYYFHLDQLQAVRSGRWKLQLALDNKTRNYWDSKPDPTPLRLFNLDDDIHEDRDVSAEHPEVVERLLAYAENARRELGDGGRRGAGQRPAGWIAQPTARVLLGD